MIANDMEHLTKNIMDSYETRVSFVKGLISETAETLKKFHNDHSKMSESLHTLLQTNFRHLQTDVANFISTAHQEQQQCRQETFKMLSGFHQERQQCRQETLNLLNNFAKSRSENMADQKKSLTNFTNHLAQDTADMLKNFRDLHSQIANDTKNLLNNFAKSRNEMHKAWKELGIKMHAFRSLGIEKVKELEEINRRRIEKEQAEAERKRREQEEREKKQREVDELKAMIIDVVEKKALKLTEIGTEIGKAWQALIPIINELISDGKLTKNKDGIYHLV